MPIAGFDDNAATSGGFAVDWNSTRFILTPLSGPKLKTPMRLAGVYDVTGDGFTREGVNLVYAADGTGQARKITRGREKPDEISLVLDFDTYDSFVEPNICPPGITRLFNFAIQVVDPAGIATRSRLWLQCATTGSTFERPSDGNVHKGTFKFQPTRRG